MAKVNQQSVFVPEDAPAVDAALVVRTIVFVLSLINAVAALFGKELHLQINQDLWYQIVSAAWLIGSSLWTAWKNNNITKAARVKQAVANQVVVIKK